MKLIPLLAVVCLVPATAFAYGEDGEVPDLVQSQATTLFSWTNRPNAAANPKGHVIEQLTRSVDCIGKIEAAAKAGKEEQIPDCEGNGMIVGPGIYTCDNPFTSHDYGNTLLVLRAKAGEAHVADLRDKLRPADMVDRDITGNRKYGAVVYDFRPTPYGISALALRDARVLDLTQTTSIKVPAGERKSFAAHAPFVCDGATPLAEVLNHWGDQLDFLALTYDPVRANFGKGFEKSGSLSDAGFVAALASDTVAIPDAALEAKITELKKISPAVAESLRSESCFEAGHSSPRMCLAYLLHDSIVGDLSPEPHPNYAWPLKTLKPVLVKLGLLDAAAAAKIKNLAALQSYLVKNFTKNPSRAQRAQEAHGCMKVVREQLRATSLETWRAPAAKGAEDAAAKGAGLDAH